MDKEKPSTKQILLRVPADVHRALKVRAAKDDTSIIAILESLIRRFLAD